jgi:hypothetical protein
LDWFIGFVEGDGCLSLSADGRVTFHIALAALDFPILEFIQNFFDFGTLKNHSLRGAGSFRFSVYHQKDLLKLIYVLNGNLLVERRRLQFERWLAAYNKKYKTTINLLPNIKQPTLENAWLAGFAAAEGCYTCSITKRVKRPSAHVRVIFHLAQQNEFALMTSLAKQLNGAYYNNKAVQVQGKNAVKIIEYFTKFSLRNRKQKEFETWLKIHTLFLAKKHLTPEGLEEMKLLQHALNADAKKSQAAFRLSKEPPTGSNS